MKGHVLHVSPGLGFLLAAFLLGCVATYPIPRPLPTLDGIELRRFDRVSEGLYRSAQPSARQLAELQQRYGLRTIVKLNRGGTDEAPAGVTVLAFPMDPLSEPSHEKIEEILAAIDQARTQGPVLIHCTHGEDRTGLIVALYQMRRLGVPLQTAYTDMMRRGFHPYRGLFNAWLRETGW